METRMVKLPSGLEVKVKPMGVLGLREIAKVNPGMLSGEATTDRAKALDTSIAMIERCTVAPNFREHPTGNGDRSIDDLDLADFTHLILELSAFNKDAVKGVTDPLAGKGAT